jgi:hypothetical protein
MIGPIKKEVRRQLFIWFDGIQSYVQLFYFNDNIDQKQIEKGVI